MLRRSLLALVAAGALVGCSAGSDSSSSTGNDGGTTTPASVAEQADCGGFEATETEELGVSEQGRCTMGGDEVIVNTFSNNDARDTWVETALKFGGPYAVGDRFVVYSDGNPDTTESLGDKLDGELRR